MKTNEFSKGKKFSYFGEISYAANMIVSRHILKKKTGNVSLFAFAKGEGLSEHTAPFDVIATIIDGAAHINIGDVSHKMDKGDSIIMPGNMPHALTAIENFKMVLTKMKDK